MKTNIFKYFDRAVDGFELAIALLLLIVTAIKFVETAFSLTAMPLTIIDKEFEKILSSAFALVIGLEFIRMLLKHTPDTIVDVLLFAIARQIILYHDGTITLLAGVLAIGGIFAIKKFLTAHKQKEEVLKNAGEKQAP